MKIEHATKLGKSTRVSWKVLPFLFPFDDGEKEVGVGFGVESLCREYRLRRHWRSSGMQISCTSPQPRSVKPPVHTPGSRTCVFMFPQQSLLTGSLLPKAPSATMKKPRVTHECILEERQTEHAPKGNCSNLDKVPPLILKCFFHYLSFRGNVFSTFPNFCFSIQHLSQSPRRRSS